MVIISDRKEFLFILLLSNCNSVLIFLSGPGQTEQWLSRPPIVPGLEESEKSREPEVQLQFRPQSFFNG